ncbi:hypothetical protein SMD20_24185 [Nonomuraea sp. LP-02]|uniref:hypothetical protein n=1 Tax=Nonomuraea sp. LP-02 TaxID=3097960 RepID=UPI002E321A8D|nr:hypothetical protein [Nonomuraea sp. LP-02]MED7927379.1 hypothetical protein [Nonomuraea sp. LP-02]
MSDNLAEALMWDGVRCVISMFVVHAWEMAPALDFRTDQVVPRQVKVYELEDEDGLLPGRWVTEYDLIFDEVPERLPGYLEVCLRRACEVGVVACASSTSPPSPPRRTTRESTSVRTSADDSQQRADGRSGEHASKLDPTRSLSVADTFAALVFSQAELPCGQNVGFATGEPSM